MNNDHLKIMRKRHAYISTLVKDYTSLEAFFREKKEWFDIIGIDVSKEDDSIALLFYLGYGEYELYHIVVGAYNVLEVSQNVEFQDELCMNSEINIFTEENV